MLVNSVGATASWLAWLGPHLMPQPFLIAGERTRVGNWQQVSKQMLPSLQCFTLLISCGFFSQTSLFLAANSFCPQVASWEQKQIVSALKV